jgi:hypothetical protein
MSPALVRRAVQAGTLRSRTRGGRRSWNRDPRRESPPPIVARLRLRHRRRLEWLRCWPCPGRRCGDRPHERGAQRGRLDRLAASPARWPGAAFCARPPVDRTRFERCPPRQRRAGLARAPQLSRRSAPGIPEICRQPAATRPRVWKLCHDCWSGRIRRDGAGTAAGSDGRPAVPMEAIPPAGRRHIPPPLQPHTAR